MDTRQIEIARTHQWPMYSANGTQIGTLIVSAGPYQARSTNNTWTTKYRFAYAVIPTNARLPMRTGFQDIADAFDYLNTDDTTE